MRFFQKLTLKSFLTLLFALSLQVQAQELNCLVAVNSDLVDQTNQQVFRTLERSLSDYINKTKWTNKIYTAHERVNCSMFITVSSYNPSTNQFVATLQVQSSRPVYNSTYESPVFNYNDKQFSFTYVEYQPLFYNANAFESNLISVITYYANIILGLDADTFALEGGTDYFKKTQEVVNLAQGSGYSGWQHNAR